MTGHSMFLLISTAAFVGFIHSLSPAHWIPIVLVSKARKWGRARAFLGALVAASGHILTSLILSIVVIELGLLAIDEHSIHEHEERFERLAGLVLVFFGLLYALWSWRHHHRCAPHAHHGPRFKNSDRHPFVFLFFMGFTPCVAVVPVLVAAAPLGLVALGGAMAAFAAGVWVAMIGATILVAAGLKWLDHPVFEHYGDVITGICVAIVGALFFIFGSAH